MNKFAAMGERIGEMLAGRQVTVMEVCGTHTHALGRYGIRQLLRGKMRLLSGPGCPVCVTDAGFIQSAVKAAHSGWTILTFGDLLRVPGPDGSLQDARTSGARVKVVYSPLDALKLAQANPAENYLFLAVGFETTTPAIAATIKQTVYAGCKNLKFLVGLKLVPPALQALLTSGEVALDGLLYPGHVSAIIGMEPYREVASQYRIPGVIGGFGPEEIMVALTRLVELIVTDKPTVVNAYRQAVRPEGNSQARRLSAEVFNSVPATWRGLGEISASGLIIRPEFSEAALAAEAPELDPPPVVAVPSGCRCGDILKGKLLPSECQRFSKECTPRTPLGPCMVSAEGSCAAYYKFGE